MVTLHIHVPAPEHAASSFALQEDMYIRSEHIGRYLAGEGTLPKDVSADTFSGDLPFVLLSPKGYRWEPASPVYIYTVEAQSITRLSAEMLLWPLYSMEKTGAPVFIIPLPSTKGRKPGKLPLLYRNVERLEHIICSIRRQSQFVLLCHGKTFYESLLMLVRDRSRKEKILPEGIKVVSLFGGDALTSCEEVIPDRKDLEEAMREFADTISVIALTNDQRIPAARILRSWMNPEGKIDASVDLVKPAFYTGEGLRLPDDELCPQEGISDVSVVQKTRYQQALRLEVTQMICDLLAGHLKNPKLSVS